MNFGSAIKYGFQNYANFKGVADRASYWWWMLFYAIVVFGVQFVSIAVSGFSMGQDSAGPAFLGGSVLDLAPLALYLPTLGLTIRRMRDVGLNPFLLLLSIVPFVLIMVGIVVGAIAGGSSGAYIGSEDGLNPFGYLVGAWSGAALGALPGLLVGLGWAIFLIVMLARPSKT
ncbi:MAG: hypothetical protein RLZ71_349, partial [Actinomycetota bacterium]